MSMSTISLTRPGRAHMMTTRWARMMASSTSWVMKKQVFCSFSQVLSSSCWSWAQLGVQVGQGLIHQQHLGIDRVGAGDGDALLHAAGELFGVGLGEALQIHHLQILVGQLLGLLLALTLELEPKLDVLLHGEPGKQGVLLEHDATVGAGTCNLCAIYQNLALGRGLQSADNIEQGGLTAAGRADNTDKLIFMNIHIHAVEGHHLTVAAVKLLDDVVDMYLYC